MLTPDRMPLVGVYSGIDNDITGADDAFLRIIGYTRAEFEESRRERQPLSPPESNDLDLAALRTATGAGTNGFTAPYQKHFVHRDGHHVPVLVVFSMIGDAPGHWVGYAVDLSLPSGPLAEPVPPDTDGGPQPSDFYERLVGELLRERTRMVSMLDHTSALVWSVDPEFRLLGANPSFREAYQQRNGRPVEIGARLDTFDEEIRAVWRVWYERALAGERFDVTFESADGSIGDYMLSPIEDATGTVLGVAVVGADVTAEHEAIAALRHRESMLRIAGRLGRIAGWTVELPSRAITISEHLSELLDLGVVGEVAFEAGLRFYPPTHRSEVRRLIERCLADGTPFDVEVPVTTPEGREIWLRVMGEASRDADGTITAVHGALADMTERRDTLAQLRQQAGLLDNATDAILVLDLDGHVTYWNRAAERMYGWTAAEAVGRHVSDVVDGGDIDKHHEMTNVLLVDGEFSGRIENVDRQGRPVIIELHVNLIRNESGEPTAVFSIASDVTERVELEERLALSQKLESVGQLTGGIAHDFNNLLTVIMGNSELLAESLAHDDDLASLNQMVMTAAERGAELTTRLLAFARRQPLQPQVVDPADVTENVLALLRRSLPENVEIECAYDDSHWHVLVDPGQLEAALMNVTLNARDAMVNGGRLAITITNAVVDDDDPDLEIVAGDYVKIAVADNGSGMSAEVRERVFDPFFTTKGPGRGSGLGLSMVYGFTRQSGGMVEIRSEPGEGTTVEMLLPRATPSIHADLFAPRPVDGLPRGDERVLVVEDEPLVRGQAVTTLRSLGYHIVEASDAPAALALLDGGAAIDLLFTDVVMPGGMSGLELVDEVRRRSPELRVLLTSGYAEEMAGPQYAGLPLLGKPYRRGVLARAVRRALDDPPAQPTRR